ncbi:unnamed protein product, partial [Chrysoparadoxa australica]
MTKLAHSVVLLLALIAIAECRPPAPTSLATPGSLSEDTEGSTEEIGLSELPEDAEEGDLSFGDEAMAGDEEGGRSDAGEQLSEDTEAEVLEGTSEKEKGIEAEEKLPERPQPPLFAFPPTPGSATVSAAEAGLEEMLPVQSRVIKYLTDDKIFGVQLACSGFFLLASLAYAVEGTSAAYQAALVALIIKCCGGVISRVNRVLVPHLLYEPGRYSKFKGRVSATARDPAAQGMLYCCIFLNMPVKKALAPLVVKEIVYVLWALKAVLGIASPTVCGALEAGVGKALGVLRLEKAGHNWPQLDAKEKQRAIGKCVAQVCFKLETSVLAAGLIHLASFVSGMSHPLAPAAASIPRPGSAAEFAMRGGQALVLASLYTKLVQVKAAQLDGEERALEGVSIRGVGIGWLEQMVNSMTLAWVMGLPWWVGPALSVAGLLDKNNPAMADIWGSENPAKALGSKLMNAAIGRRLGGEEEEEEVMESSDEQSGEEREEREEREGSKIKQVVD